MADESALLEILDRTTAALRDASLDDPRALESCLQERLEALRGLDPLSGFSPDLVAALQQSFDGGRALEQRLRLRRAALRTQLAENHTTQILFRALSAPISPRVPAVDALG